jgi:phage shock protein A
MGFLERLSSTIAAKANAALAAIEDPRQSLDYEFEQQRDRLGEIERGIVEVMTSRKRIEAQCIKTRMQITGLDIDARTALDEKRTDAARHILARKIAMQKNLLEMDAAIDMINDQGSGLMQYRSDLQIDLDALSAKRSILKAQYSAADAKIKMHEASMIMGKGTDNLGLQLARAEDLIDYMSARAEALDELSPINHATDEEIEAELEKLRK